jgi:AhpD family alkylhydroperoxidase
VVQSSVVPGSIAALCPEAADRWDELHARVWAEFDPGVLTLVARRVAWLLGDHVVGQQPTAAGSFERAAIDLAEQMVIDVSGVTPKLLDPLALHVGPDRVRDVVTGVFVIEFSHRLRAISSALLPGGNGGSRSTPALPVGVTIRQMIDAYAAAVMRMHALDPVTTELVRLRCARTHHCRICQTLRLAEARDAGVDESVAGKIDAYEQSDLPETAKVALRITDALIGLPGELSAETIERAHELFTTVTVAELCLDITKWSVQKVHVALGVDGAEGVEPGALLRFEADGRPAPFR